MQCPTCHVDLLISERQGIEIDYCPRCRGIWLDRGELDKLLDRAALDSPARRHDNASPPPPAYPEPGRRPRAHDDDDSGEYPAASRPRRRKSFLSELFDFD